MTNAPPTTTKNAFPVKKMKLAELKPHPKQATIFSDLGGAKLQELADDIFRNGLRTPLEVKPDGTIICGHQRARACRKLGWTEVDVVVREDLTTEAEVTERLIEDNLHRRQLDQLSIARSYVEWKKNAANLPREEQKRYQGIDLRDQLAKTLHMSGRNLDRLRRLVDLPMEIQREVSESRLSIKAAGKIALLPVGQQQQFVRELFEGENAEEIAQRYLSQGKPKQKSASQAFDEFVRLIRKAQEVLDGRLEELKEVYMVEGQIEVILDHQQLLEEVLGQVPNSRATTEAQACLS